MDTTIQSQTAGETTGTETALDAETVTTSILLVDIRPRKGVFFCRGQT